MKCVNYGQHLRQIVRPHRPSLKHRILWVALQLAEGSGGSFNRGHLAIIALYAELVNPPSKCLSAETPARRQRGSSKPMPAAPTPRALPLRRQQAGHSVGCNAGPLDHDRPRRASLPGPCIEPVNAGRNGAGDGMAWAPRRPLPFQLSFGFSSHFKLRIAEHGWRT